MAPMIKVRNVSKQYALGGAEPLGTLREALTRGFRSPQAKPGTFWALDDVSFDVETGEVVGIIGANGAGKSTLLKILSRITPPTRGRIMLRGRMASLLEVGTGFHPELTGRENIFLNGAILGMSRQEIRARFDEIVAFAEIEQFLDTPVKRYSSGMYVRLAFAVAAHLEPEILVVDEVLAVGDAAFQKKCLGKMSEVTRQGRTILFVSHNMAAVENLCRRGVVLRKGRLIFDGGTSDAIGKYLHGISGGLDRGETHALDLRQAPGRPAQCRPMLTRVEFYSGDGTPLTGVLPMGDSLRIKIHFELNAPAAGIDAGIGFDNLFGQRIFTAHSSFEPAHPQVEDGGAQVFVCEIPSFTLVPGEYVLKLALDINGREGDIVEDAARLHVVESDYYGTGRVPWNGAIVLEHHWYAERRADALPSADALKGWDAK